MTVTGRAPAAVVLLCVGLAALPAAAQVKAALEGHKSEVTGVAFSPDGKLLASCGAEDVKLWAVEGWSQLYAGAPKAEGTLGARGLSFSPDGKRLAVAANPPALLDVATRTWKTAANIPTLYPRAAVFSPDGAWFAVIGERGVFVYDAATLAPRARVGAETEAMPLYQAAAVSPDGKTLAVGGRQDHAAHLFDTASWKEKGQVPVPARVTALAYSRDGALLAVGADAGSEGALTLWDVRSGKEAGTLTGGELNAPRGLAFTQDGKYLATADDNFSVKIWVVSKRKLRLRVGGHDNGARSVDWTPDGKLLASGGDDARVQLYDAP